MAKSLSTDQLQEHARRKPPHEMMTINMLEIIREAELESVTIKSVIESLEKRLDISLDSRLDEVKDIVDTILMDRVMAEEDAKLAQQLHQQELQGRRTRAVRTKLPQVTKRSVKGQKTAATGFNRPMVLSPALSNVLDGQQLLSRPAVVKGIWAYVKKHDLQDPKNKKMIICDEKLQPIFKKAKVDCFQMNRYLSNHLHTQEEIMRQEDSSEEDLSDEDTAIGENPDLSPPLEPKKHNIRGEAHIPDRLKPLIPNLTDPTTYRSIQEGCMEYVKSHSLFDPQNPTNIQLDDKIQVALGLTNESTLTLFDFIDRIKDIIQDG